jgi:hypothetical protein
VTDPTAANRFYTAAFGLGTQIRLRASEAPTTGFRGFTLSLTVSQPATVKDFIGTALEVGAAPLKPAPSSSPPRRVSSSWRSTGAVPWPRTPAYPPTAPDRTGS